MVVPFETQHLDDLSMQNAEQILPKGAILRNRYEIIRILGLGGMGSVYLARDLNFAKIERLCAIKEMVSATTDPKFRKTSLANFEREANTLASINHPHIVKIYDYFTEGARTYLVMEHVSGHDLEKVLSNLPEQEYLEEGRLLKWGLDICDILDFLHNHEPPIVYRDLKPSNLMLRDEGADNLTMIDFGIAKAFQEGQKGTMMGTEGYSPPEQYRGIASPQGDVYALGATLHHLLTKRDPKLEPPFSFHEALPRSLNPSISVLTEKVIMRALNYDMKARFPSAKEMKMALELALRKLQGGGSSRDQTKFVSPGGKTELIGATESKSANRTPSRPVEPTRGLSLSERMGMTAAIDMPNINTGNGGILPVWVFKTEDEIRSSPAMGNGQVFIGAYDNNLYALDAKSGEFRWKYPTEGGVVSTPFFYKDRVIFGSEDRIMYTVTSHRGKILWTCPTDGRIRSSARVEFEHAFFGSDDGYLYAVNAQSGRVVWKFEAGAPIRTAPRIDNEIVYCGCEDGHMYALDMQTGKMKWKFRTGRGINSSPVIHDELLLFGSTDWTFYAINKISSYSSWRTRTSQAIISSPALHQGIVYFGSVDDHLYAMDADSGRTLWKFKAGSHIVSSPAVSDEAVYFGTSAGVVFSVSLKNGQERWQFETGGPVPSSPVLGDGVVYIGSTDHNLYALPA